MRCAICGKNFARPFEGEIHEWNCEYKHRKNEMGKIYIGVYSDELKEFTTDIPADCMEGFFVPTEEACDFIERYFLYDGQYSPWRFVEKEPGFYYRDDDDWYDLDEQINELLELKSEMKRQMED